MKSATSSPMLACPCSCAERCAVLCSWLPQESIAAFEQSQYRRTKCVLPARRYWLDSNSPFDSCRNQLYTAIMAVLQYKGHARSRSDRLRDGLPCSRPCYPFNNPMGHQRPHSLFLAVSILRATGGAGAGGQGMQQHSCVLE